MIEFQPFSKKHAAFTASVEIDCGDYVRNPTPDEISKLQKFLEAYQRVFVIVAKKEVCVWKDPELSFPEQHGDIAFKLRYFVEEDGGGDPLLREMERIFYRSGRRETNRLGARWL